MRGIVLSGGGARGAYQVGVLKTIAEICEKENWPHPFDVYNGMSAGAINVTKLAQYRIGFWETAAQLEQLWSQIRSSQVYDSHVVNLGKIGLRWVSHLSLGGWFNYLDQPSLLDTAPLRRLVTEHFDGVAIENNLQKGAIKAIVISAFNYSKDYLVHFVASAQKTPNWDTRLKKSQRVTLSPQHILASSAIPILFPPEKIDDHWYGDGCLRNYSPSAPAIYLGADRLILVGVKNREVEDGQLSDQPQSVSLALILDAIIKSVLLDPFEYDLERLDRVNLLAKECQKATNRYRVVKYLSIVPSQDIGQLALKFIKKLPRTLRFLFQGLGPESHVQQLASYLLFEPEFIHTLIDLGYYDSQKYKDEIRELIHP